MMEEVSHGADGRMFRGRRSWHSGRTLTNVPLGQVRRMVDGQGAQQVVVVVHPVVLMTLYLVVGGASG